MFLLTAIVQQLQQRRNLRLTQTNTWKKKGYVSNTDIKCINNWVNNKAIIIGVINVKQLREKKPSPTYIH
jgi:hypothetical protein